MEPIQQHSIASITDCQVQMAAHRKQGNVLPTLALQISPDPTTDKLRKRRSSRTAGLTTMRDSGPISLWFRLGEDQTYTLTEWADYIRSLMQPNLGERHPISPVSPVSPTFINPFPPQPSETCKFTRSSSGNTHQRSTLQHKTSNQTYGSSTYGSSHNHRTMYSSGTPSLRSLESDMSSSHASSHNVPQASATYSTQQQYTSVHPSDISSPTTATPGYQDDFIEGWTTAQGRPTTLSSPVRVGRESVVSARGHMPLGSNSSSPPGPRETILDRAFQMRYIPGAETEVPGEEKLSSLARFDALMREAEERRRAKELDATTVKAPPQKSTRAEVDSGEARGDVGRVLDDEDSDYDEFDHGLGYGDAQSIDPAQKTLDLIASRRRSVQAPRPRHISRNSLSYHESPGRTDGPSIMRPHTAHSKSRPAMSPRTSSQPQPVPPSLDRLTLSSMPPTGEGSTHRHHEKRNSVNSVKRLSFTEFTKRLSSTSSLLLVQTNQSASSRASSEMDGTQPSTPRGTSLNPRGAPLSPDRDQGREERCGWRNSVGVFGDGGFV